MVSKVIEKDPLSELKSSHGLKPELFDRVIKAYQSELLSLITGKLYRKLGKTDCHTAEDLLQDVWLSVFKNIDRYDPSLKNPIAWLVTIADNRCRSYFRRHPSPVSIDEDNRERCLKDTLADRKTPAPSFRIIEEERVKLRAALVARIHHKWGDLRFERLWGTVVNKESYIDMANRTNLVVGTLKSQLSAIRTKTKSQLGRIYQSIEE